MLGEKIRRKRNEAAMSMKELSDLTGLSPGFISQVERELAEPSITSLRKIAEALDVAVFHFFVEESNASRVVRHNERQTIAFPESQVTYELLSPDLNRQMETFMGTLEPGGTTCEEPMAHIGEEVIFVIEGQLFIAIGGDEYTLYHGDTIYYYANIPHKITNTGDVPLKFISTITPPRF